MPRGELLARPDAEQSDALVIGGGFFGCVLALHLRRDRGERVTLLEAGENLLERASYTNQARVHHGYHYPRSILTGLRSRVNFPRFVADFRDCVTEELDAYYAIARQFSNVTAAQFTTFCDRIGAPCKPAGRAVRELFDAHRIEDVFRVTEYAFDAARLRERLRRELSAAGVDVRCDTEAKRVTRDGALLQVDAESEGTRTSFRGRRVFNCTYSRANELLSDSGLPTVPLRHEIAEIALIRPPPELEGRAVTIMCGPFFSVMPFPARDLYSLYHVRYTLHGAWSSGPDHAAMDPFEVLLTTPKRTAYLPMQKDSIRYVPCMQRAEYVESLWEVRTVLPLSDRDDSRPILLSESDSLDGLYTVVGGKIDNVYDVLESLPS